MTKRSEEIYTGYEEDPELAVAKYIRGLAGGEAKRNMVVKMLQAFTGTDVTWEEFKEQSEDATWADYRKHVKENMIDQRVRKLTPEFMSYTIAKMGLWAFTQTAAQALAPRVRVNAIGPGPTLQGHRQSDQHFARQRAATILKRGANVQDITAALGYLLSAPGVTGQLICVDGGQHLGWQTPDVLGVE